MILSVLLATALLGQGSSDVGARVAEFARSQLGQPVGDGQCYALASEALRAAGARPPSDDGAWGTPVESLSEAQPGDILQFTDTVFVTRSPIPGGGILTRTYRSPKHTAIVVEVRRRRPRAQLLVMHQNAGFDDTPEEQRMAVQPWLIDMRAIRSGKIQAFRPVSETDSGLLNAPAPRSDTTLIFTSFRGNGEDGLHLATSADGYTWTPLNHDQPLLKPAVGGGLMRDPCLARGPDDTYHLVWTTAWSQHGLGHATSSDLVHWSDQTLLDVMAAEPTARNVWAPEMYFDARDGRFWLYWSSTIPGRFPETEAGGDDGYNHRVYATTTTDFETFTPTRLLFEPGHNVIDATIARDGPRILLFYKDETRTPPAKNIWLTTAPAPDGPFGMPIGPITGAYWAEGPTAVEFGGRWLVYFDKYQEHRYGLVTSLDLKTWTDESDRVHFPADHRHGTVLRVPRSIVEGIEAAAGEVPK